MQSRFDQLRAKNQRKPCSKAGGLVQHDTSVALFDQPAQLRVRDDPAHPFSAAADDAPVPPTFGGLSGTTLAVRVAT